MKIMTHTKGTPRVNDQDAGLHLFRVGSIDINFFKGHGIESCLDESNLQIFKFSNIPSAFFVVTSWRVVSDICFKSATLFAIPGI